MPSWNTGAYIADSVRSVIRQTYQKWELLIVDDCSTDDTNVILKALLSDPRIRIFRNEENCGAALSRNRALREAKGEWIAFLDSDDLWMPEKLEKQIAFMYCHGYVFSYTEYERIDEKGRSLHTLVSGPLIVDKRMIYHYDYIGQLTMMYSAKSFGLIQIQDIKKNNDYAIRLRLFQKPGTVCHLLPESLARYRVRKQSISHDRLGKKLRSHYDLFRVCDARPPLTALWYTGWNMFFGLLKKLRFEKKVSR